MNKSKDDLLKELKELGVHPSGRKVRADVGGSHERLVIASKPRKDKGKSRGSYTKTAAYHRRIFNTYVEAHITEFGDNLTRDVNEIFPPNVDSYYKLITTKDGQTYRSSVKRRNHPEYLRWQWWMAELAEAKTLEEKLKWENLITKWYFIRQEDLLFWTYYEWSFAYFKKINGQPNRYVADRVILNYDEFLYGFYGTPKYDNKGDLIYA